MVTSMDERGLELKDKDGPVRRIDSVAKVWAAGVQANPLSKTLSEQSGAPLDRAGRISVNPDLTLPRHPEVFVHGDMLFRDNLRSDERRVRNECVSTGKNRWSTY